MLRKVITFGTFDLFHIGHIRILERAKELGDYLIVGVSSDSLNFQKKGRVPLYPEHDRVDMLRALRCVDKVFVEESLELKRYYVEFYEADVFVMGDDWVGKFDDQLPEGCEPHYLRRTPSISTTEIIELAKDV